MDESIYTLRCSFAANEPNKPTSEEILDWLENKSGLPEEYFDKITQVTYDIEKVNAMVIRFQESVNCFIALREITSRTVFGKKGKCNIFVKHPRAKFGTMRIKSGNKVLFSKNEIINSVKSYGEIVEIKNVFWRDTSREINIPTGDVDVRILAKKQLPLTLDIGGETFKIRHLTNNQHADEVMNALWNNLKLNKEIDYKYKIFKLVEKQMGCGLVCKFTQSFADLPTHRDVYEWLTKESGLSEDYLVKIVAFKKISDTEYKIIFDDTVNCLLALAEMDTRRVVDSFDIGYEIEVNCLKGKFIDVMLASKNADGILLRKDTEDALMVYGPMTEFERLNVSNFGCGKVKCDVKCKLFKLKELPDTLEVKGVKYDVVEIDCEQDGQEEKTLIRIWEELKIYE